MTHGNNKDTAITLTPVTKITDEITPSKIMFESYLNQHADYNEFAQSRTNFQLEKFIAMADNTPVNCFVNLLHQKRVMHSEMLREIKEATELMRNFKLKYPEGDDTPADKMVVWPNHEGVPTNCWYDLDKVAHDHRVSELSINVKDKVQQMEYIDKMLAQMEKLHGGKFTREEYETEAPEYWNARAKKQVLSSIINARLGIDSGNFEMVLNGTAQPLLPDSKNTPMQFPVSIFSALASGNQEAINQVINALQIDTVVKISNTAGHPISNENKQTLESLGVTGPTTKQ